jgi:hypothetical protein
MLIRQADRKFFAYHRENPRIYKLFVKFARQAKKAGYQKYSIWAIMNQVRWHVNVETHDPNGVKFKISNDYSSRYSRLIMKQERDLKGFFVIKQLKEPSVLDEGEK